MFEGLGYAAEYDEHFTKQPRLAFCFDESSATCNSSPADSEKYKQALAALAQHKEIQIVSNKGGFRYSASTIKDSDRIIVPRQFTLILSPRQ